MKPTPKQLRREWNKLQSMCRAYQGIYDKKVTERVSKQSRKYNNMCRRFLE